MSIHDNVFDLLEAAAEQKRAEEVRDWLLGLDEFDKQFYFGLAHYLAAHPEKLAELSSSYESGLARLP